MASKQIDLLAAGIVDSSGNPLQSGTAELYEAGTSTPVTGYADASLSSSLGSIITLDSRGAKLVFVDGLVDLKIIIKDVDSNVVNTYDGLDYDASGLSSIESDPELVLQNTDQEDTDGGRQSTIRHKGSQSGGEISTLVTAVASHFGSSDDQQGQYIISVNDGNDADSPSIESLKLTPVSVVTGKPFESTGNITITGGDLNIPTGNIFVTAGNITVGGTVDGVDVSTFKIAYDAHVADATLHFTEASIDHGSISGLGDDDHTQYALVTGARAFTGGVTVNTGGVTVSAGGVSVTGNSGYGITAGSAFGNLHVRSAASGATAVSADGDELILEGSGNSGATILAGTAANACVYFGDSTDTDKGTVCYNNPTNTMVLRAGTTDTLYVNGGNVGLGNGNSTPSEVLDVNGNADISGSLTVAGITVDTGSSGSTPSTNANELFVDDSTNSGITIGSGLTSQGSLFFANSGNNGAGRIVYDHNSNYMSFGTSGDTQALVINSSGSLGIGTTSPESFIHIQQTDSLVAPSTSADDFFIEGNVTVGMTMATLSTSGSCAINFGDTGDSDIGSIFYDNSSDSLNFRAGTVNLVAVDDTTMTVTTASSGTSLSSDGDEFHIQNSGVAGMTISSGTTSSGNILFGRSTDNDAGRISYSHLSNQMTLSTSGVPRVGVSSSEFQPSSDNSLNLGTATNRWAEVFAVNGTINTSDEREKTLVNESIDNEFIDVAKNIKIKSFKWNDSINNNGLENARIHYGVMAQDVKKAFEDKNIDPSIYSMFCYDEWDEETDSDGNVTRESGNRYGVRYNELFALKIMALEARIEELESIS